MAFLTSTKDFYYQGYLWKIMSFKEGTNTKIMTSIFDQLIQLIIRYAKVFIVRFDLRFCIDMANNTLISKFRDKLNRKLRKKYNCDIGYAWAREQTNTATTPHYHCAVFLNGHKVRKAFPIGRIIDDICDSLLYISPFFPNNNGYMIQRRDSKSIQRVIYRLSYLAKNKSKENTAKGIANYQVSRLKTPASR